MEGSGPGVDIRITETLSKRVYSVLPGEVPMNEITVVDDVAVNSNNLLAQALSWDVEIEYVCDVPPANAETEAAPAL